MVDHHHGVPAQHETGHERCDRREGVVYRDGKQTTGADRTASENRVEAWISARGWAALEVQAAERGRLYRAWLVETVTRS